MIRRKIGWVIAASSALLLGGCERVLLEEMAGLTGTEVSFGASTMWQNEDETRTEYSGSLTTTSPKYERIDWTPPTDRIRIVCAEVETDTKTLADYDLLPTATADGKVSQASIRPSSSSPTNGNGLHWGSGTHHFFAWYPAPGMASNYSSTTTVGSESSIALVSGETAATVTGTIPATQTYVSTKTTTKNGVTTTEYKPNMNYAYMYAHATGTPTGSNVLLQFKPLVTALEFTLKAGDNTSATYRLKSLKLTSTSSNLTGKFTIKLKSDGGYDDSATTAYQSTGKTITIPFSNTPTLNTTNIVKATVLCLPVKQTALTVTLTLDSGNGTTEFTRTLPLQFSNGNSIEVAATKKAYISNVGVPGTTYYLEVKGPAATDMPFGNLGVRSVFQVKSYSNTRGTNTAEAWTAQFSENGTSWSSTPPAWLYGASSGTNVATSGNGGTAFENCYFELEANQNDPGVSTSNRRNNYEKGHAIDVSFYSATGAPLSSRNTANCYVISRPGWYKIPLAYGNSIKNGTSNTVAFRPGGSTTGWNGLYLNQFVNYADAAIANAWIYHDGITADGAKLLWQDSSTPTVVDVSMEKNSQGYSAWLYFRVSDPFIQGNAVVGAFVGNTIVWSWHIWLNSNPASDFVTQVVQYKGTDGNNNFTKSVDMMAIDLGESKQHNLAAIASRSVQVKITQTSSGKTSTFTITQNGRAARTDALVYPTYYQWGRKDPFPPSAGTTGNSALRPQSGSYPIAYTTGNLTAPERASIGTAIKNPNKFYRQHWQASNAGYSRDWCTTTCNNLWDAGNHVGVDADVTKTIYDPCPYGFTVPSRNVYTGFVTVAPPSGSGGDASKVRKVGNFNQGYTFYTRSNTSESMFFRATGLISGGQNSLVIEGFNQTKADRWMSVQNEYPVDFLFVNTNSVNPLNGTGLRGWGAAVRPIKDKKL